ncbi:cell wall-binding repeat-containing protein [Stomatohabitans albus]|uniref:cell wall-binding repeat-containing protein n=1 Tax=Stomatohabitans albus TaxID=3110766 RepID=UPI00300C443E
MLRRLVLSVAATAALTGAVFAADATVSPSLAVAESACYSSPAGDVDDLATKQIVNAPEADLLGVCVDHSDQRVQISARAMAMHDPKTSPVWENEKLALGAVIDTNQDNQPEFSVNWVRLPGGRVESTVARTDNSDKMCDAKTSFTGVQYIVEIPTECIGKPDNIKAAVFLIRNPSFLPDGTQLGQINDVPNKRGMVGPFRVVPDIIGHRVRRLSGPSRVHTAMAISQNHFGGNTAGAIVLARQGDFPDALAASSLARAVNGPVLLTVNDQLYGEVAQEMRRVLGPGGTVYLAGGPNALNPQVEQQVRSMGYNAVRLAGPSRVETATAIANVAKQQPSTVVVADGREFADALIAGSLASHLGGVQLLTNGSDLHPANAQWLASHPGIKVIAIGAKAREALGTRAHTVYDAGNPMATSLLVAQKEYTNPTTVGIANGTRFPDGLAGAPNIAAAHGPLLLTYPDVLPPEIKDWLSTQTQVTEVRGYGGPVAMSNQILNDAGRK